MEVKNRHGTGGRTEDVFVCRIWQSCRLVAVEEVLGTIWRRFGGDLDRIHRRGEWTGFLGWDSGAACWVCVTGGEIGA